MNTRITKEIKETLKKFIGSAQLSVMLQNTKGEEGEFFITKLLEVYSLVASMPKTYETDGQGKKAVVQLHYFLGGWDWYITEKDKEAEQHQAFGWASPPDYEPEAGYISIVELLTNHAELDLYWKPKTIEELGL